MYEMEGASQSHSSHEPIARPTEPAERATIGRRDHGELRSTRCPPPLKAPSGVARQFGRPLSRTPSARCSLAQTPGLWCSLGSEVSPRTRGHRLWWRVRFLPPPTGPRKGLGDAFSRFFTMARLIHRTWLVTPSPGCVVHQLSTGSSTRPHWGSGSQLATSTAPEAVTA